MMDLICYSEKHGDSMDEVLLLEPIITLSDKYGYETTRPDYENAGFKYYHNIVYSNTKWSIFHGVRITITLNVINGSNIDSINNAIGGIE